MDMENKNSNFKSKLLNQPQTVSGGLVYSASVIGMAIISFIFVIAITAVATSLQTTTEILSQKNWYKYLSYILYQIVYVAIIIAYAFLYRKMPAEIGYRKTHFKYFLIDLLLGFGLLFGLNFVNNLFALAIEKLGGKIPVSSLPSLKGGGIVGVLIVVALLPAVLEESIFRGIILNSTKQLGTVSCCLLGGLLFSIFHQNPLQTVYQFICGVAFTLLAVRSGSILPTVLAHFLNNAVIIFNERFGFLNALNITQSTIIYVVAGIALVLSLVYLIFFDKKTNAKKQTSAKPFIFSALAGIILCAILWISALASYFM